MSLGVNFDYTYNGTLLTEVMFKPSVGTPSIDSLARIQPGSKYKIQIPRVGIFNNILKEGTSCSRTDTVTDLNITNQTVELKKVEMYTPFCKDDFEGLVGNILSEEYLRSGVEEFDIGGTQIQQYITRLLEDAQRRSVFNLVSFGDDSDGDSFYGIMEGIWPRLIANSGNGSSYCIPKVASFGTAALAANEALEAFRASYENADAILDQIPESQKYFACTRSVYDNLMASYESNTTGSDLALQQLQDGVRQLTYRGIPVVKISAWDVALADATNPLNGTTSHLLLYTVRDNHVVGVDNSADLNRIEGWFDRDTRNYKFESFMRLGYNYVHCNLQTIAF